MWLPNVYHVCLHGTARWAIIIQTSYTWKKEKKRAIKNSSIANSLFEIRIQMNTNKHLVLAYLPILPVFPGVSKFFIKSPDLPVRAPNLPDKMDFWAFLCFSLKFSPFFHKLRTFLIHCTVSGTFLHMFSQWQRLVHHYNDESTFWSHVRHVRCHIMS